jgi:hypothetical protein
MKQFITATWTAAMVCLTVPATAHHVVSQYGISPSEPQTIGEVSLQAKSFKLGKVSGTSMSLIPRLEYSPWNWVSVGARLPIARVALDNRRNVEGIGDTSVSAKFRLYASTHGEFIVSTGIGSELPTGDPDKGLSSDHVELTPFVTFSASPADSFALFGTVTESLSATGSGHESGGGHSHGQSHNHSHLHGSSGSAFNSVHGSLLNPHSDHETQLELGAAYIIDDYYLSGHINPVYSWSRVSDPLGPVNTGGELGWRPDNAFRLALNASFPVFGPKRFDWKTQLAVTGFF